ncbi:hypothetical protein A9P82_06530 [Arachidicoccus ginsenosidimutans]|uniref:YqgE/AlgH family protein n=1 Tax=Arachidicoccus sp. BS20 TaxID=1850526 RepID=UPI0007F0ED61|nr:YqgE/AlgH family protein [Arachidicoccus sp. BS20]ANI88980.1 hypothetical protein A9P82_06530 [Arachidicoccus sp. BS20]
MNIGAGTFIISTPAIGDEHFEKVVIFVTEHNKNGTSGFVINKLFPLKLNDLLEFNHSLAFQLYHGGPVENEKLYILHQRPDLIEGGIELSDTTFLGGNFEQVVVHINNGTLTGNDIKLFIGYCGWDYGQLETEVAEGYWLSVSLESIQAIFSANDTLLWDELYATWAN